MTNQVYSATLASYAVPLRALALVAVLLQAILLFHAAKGRYAYLAWLLVFPVFIVVVRENFLPWLRRTCSGLSDRLAQPGTGHRFRTRGASKR
jgi:predicted small integral membrane protein